MENQEVSTLKLRNCLESWREVVVLVHSILLWDNNWYPAAIFGGTSFVFCSLWLFDPSVLTTFSIVGLTISISDYLVPKVSAALFRSELWTDEKEEAFNKFCANVVACKFKFVTLISSFYGMRCSNTKMYYGCTILGLAVLAWIGNTFNNLFLTYTLITTFLLIPGLIRHRILDNCVDFISKKLSHCPKFSIAKKEQ
ncbi:hypothetical protein PPYR_12405 [Photinus pyralis]|uniref:ADP-ribosylation factor-like protein 6-interacting protein 1 n=1 Tax=Photinus pyralis TaxID=7054 RepID=A0A1Y1LQL2_PHOPY|nr:ADP-ribosylation factor-like protein 6-interacting protein 1 [Photinus pyralis]KAB0795566.1 hypothetical protein PPYR_12405 [Photinus pyralis]